MHILINLLELFPEEKTGIEGIFEDMEGITNDIRKYSAAGGKINMNTFAQDFPYLIKDSTVHGEML